MLSGEFTVNVLYPTLVGLTIAAVLFFVNHLRLTISRSQSGRLSDYVELQILRRRDPAFRSSDTLVRWKAAAQPIKHQLGDAAGQFDWASTPGQGRGYMSYGPYIRLPPGSYGAEFAISVDVPTEPTQEPLFYLDVTAEDPLTGKLGTFLLGRKIAHYPDLVDGDRESWIIPFQLDRIFQFVEFRVYTYGNSSLRYHSVVLATEESVIRVRYGPGESRSSSQ